MEKNIKQNSLALESLNQKMIPYTIIPVPCVV